jgi:hypothetical protein
MGAAAMRTDSSRESKPADLWHLPDVLSVKASKVRFPQPRLYYVGTRPVLAEEAVEILVRTDRPFPVRALSPAIFVGDVPILDFETMDRNAYRFLSYDSSSLREGAAISLGWPQFPQRKVKTRFVYHLGGPELIS